ncbi:hypothetical protein TcasGA2_TC004552 [Tribolium castaneum]|uniref:Uncharacterized protein n=1 Tax=Tribolium castaneum TaxID=7070 RepID=D6WB26_TRICA|nr:hypothetical protein TcasGA2_TC004552 [Tribolium castaneum]
MPFADESEKKKLYEFDSSYLTELNQIRTQLNLVTISDDEEDPTSDVQVPPSPKFTFNEELYDCNTDYMKELNDIRKQLNLKEIVEGGSSSKESAPKIETKTLFINNGAVRRKKKPTKVVQLDANYTPPKKKKRSQDSSPSENSSPVRENPYIFPDFAQVKTNFCSLNVPTCDSPEEKPKSKVTILVDEELQSLRSHNTCLTTGLDIPRISNNVHTFPSIVHIDKWATIFTHEAKLEIFSPKSCDSKRVRKKVSLGESKAIETFPQMHGDQKIENKMLEVETISSLNNMYHVKRKSNDVSHVETVTTSADDSKSESGEEVKVGCRCFSICFNKRSPNFFS